MMKKTTRTLDEDLIIAISENADLADIRKILQEFKRSGVQATAVEQLLSELLVRNPLSTPGGDGDDAVEDKILEVLDIVTGFCSDHMKVW